MLLCDARNESRSGAAERRNRRIETEFRTKVAPVLNRAQVLTVADFILSHAFMNTSRYQYLLTSCI